MASLAVYAVVYPGVLRFLPEFWKGLEPQLDADYELYLSLDGVSEEQVRAVVGPQVSVQFVKTESGMTPAEIRRDALAMIVKQHEGVILLDSDDVLLNGRLLTARAALDKHDVYAAALEVVGEDGAALPVEPFTLNAKEIQELEAGTLLARVNAFGFSNTAYRSEVLAPLLDVAPETVMLDWLVASRAHLAGASFTFDVVPRMRYRQYGRNTASVLAPFSPERVRQDCGRVVEHFRLLLDAGHGNRADVEPYEVARAKAGELQAWLADDQNLRTYTDRLNSLPPRTYLWWEHISQDIAGPTGLGGSPAGTAERSFA